MVKVARGERGWAFNNNGRLEITLGVTGDAQEGDFMNATLQATGNEPNLEFSIATHVEVPSWARTEEQLADYLGSVFGDVVKQHPELHVEIQLGPADDGEEYYAYVDAPENLKKAIDLLKRMHGSTDTAELWGEVEDFIYEVEK